MNTRSNKQSKSQSQPQSSNSQNNINSNQNILASSQELINQLNTQLKQNPLLNNYQTQQQNVKQQNNSNSSLKNSPSEIQYTQEQMQLELRHREEQSWKKLKTMFLDLLGLKYHEEFDDDEFKKEYNNYRHFFIEKNFQAFCQSMFIYIIAFTAYGLISYYVECKYEQQKRAALKMQCVPFIIFLQQLMDNQIWLIGVLFVMVMLKQYVKKKMTDRSWYFTQIFLLTLAYVLMIVSDFSLQNMFGQQQISSKQGNNIINSNNNNNTNNFEQAFVIDNSSIHQFSLNPNNNYNLSLNENNVSNRSRNIINSTIPLYYNQSNNMTEQDRLQTSTFNEQQFFTEKQPNLEQQKSNEELIFQKTIQQLQQQQKSQILTEKDENYQKQQINQYKKQDFLDFKEEQKFMEQKYIDQMQQVSQKDSSTFHQEDQQQYQQIQQQKQPISITIKKGVEISSDKSSKTIILGDSNDNVQENSQKKQQQQNNTSLHLSEEDILNEQNKQQMRTVYMNMIFKFFFPLFIMHSVMENLIVKLTLFIFTLLYFVYQMPNITTSSTNDAYFSIMIQNIFLAILFALGFVFQEYKRQDNFVSEFKQIKQMRQNMKFLLTNVLSMQSEQQNNQYLLDMHKKIMDSKKQIEGKFDYINSFKKIFNRN